MLLSFPYYYATRPSAESPVELPVFKLEGTADAAGYIPDDDLVAAVNVALLLGQPLLLTGEPGTGKTQLAYHLSHQFGWGKPLLFEAKSTSTARDLFYTYDALGRFDAKEVGKASKNPADYIEYNALGRAILRSRERSDIERYLPDGYEHDGPKRSVVLIDEVDKAPRDFPNDILTELENLYFKVPQINNTPIEAKKTYRPVVVITSNSEKNLPAAFLRRCTFFNIEFPNDAKLKVILETRAGKFLGSDPFYDEAVFFFAHKLRAAKFDKAPATAELIAWIVYLREVGLAGKKGRSKENRPLLGQSLSALVKSREDQQAATAVLDDWLKAM